MTERLTLEQLKGAYPDVDFRITARPKSVSFVASKGEIGISGTTNTIDAALLAMTLAAPVIAGEYAREDAQLLQEDRR